MPILDDTGTIDFCDARVCPADMTPTDTDGDGAVDQCIGPDPTPEATPEPTPEPEPEPTAESTETGESSGPGDS